VEIDVRTHAAATVIVVRGEVDLYTSPKLREAVLAAVKRKAPAVTVDLSGVGYMDSSGVATLVEGLQLSRGHGGQFVLAGLTPGVQQVFHFARLDKVFEIRGEAPSA
jgi:anti-sigma B factor antagonist